MSLPATGLRPVRDNTLRAQIATQLNAVVTSGRYLPGERLTEGVLADELGVSRVPLRETFGLDPETACGDCVYGSPHGGVQIRTWFMIHQIIYSSKATRPMKSADLERILVDARTGNEARNVTGALVYVDGVFLQVLEGQREVLNALVPCIRDDNRHAGMKVFYEAEIPARAFKDWTMAYLGPDVADMSRWSGLEGTGTIDELLHQVHRDTRQVPKILISIVEAIAAQSKEG